jgi:hypothetical protein
VNSEWRLAISDWWMIFLEGSAPALPKILGASGDAPSRNFCRMNSALKKIRHQPLAKASGMKFGLAVQQSNLWCRLRSITRLHSCTLTRLHA